MLLEIFCGDTIAGQLRGAGQLIVFINDLLRRAAHLAFGAGTVEYPIDNIAAATGVAIAVAF